jgi:hypothetical protein
MIGSKQDLDQYNAISAAIHGALEGKELRVDIILDVFASYVAAGIAVHPSTRQQLEQEFMRTLQAELLRYDKGEQRLS